MSQHFSLNLRHWAGHRCVAWLTGLSLWTGAAFSTAAMAQVESTEAASPIRLRGSPQLSAPRVTDSDNAVARFFRADVVRGFGKQIFEAEGSVEVRSRRQVVSADWARYDANNADPRIEAKGNVVFRSLFDRITGTELDYRFQSAIGFVVAPTYSFARFRGVGSGRRLEFVGPDQYILRDADYTTCKGPNPAWCLHVKDLHIDNEREIGVAKEARVYFMDVPVFYWPSLDFPLGRERKSGVLSPTFGSTGVRGFELSLPYYLNLAENYDATLTPRVMTRRGLQLNSQFRYLMPDYRGEVQVDYLPHDRVADRNRLLLGGKHIHSIAPGVTVSLDALKVSDDAYFVDLADRITTTSLTTLARTASLNVERWGWSGLARVLRYQTLQDPNAPITAPYERAPQVNASRVWRDVGGFDARVEVDYSRFDHRELVRGDRALVWSSLAFPLRSPGSYVTPKVQLHATDYRFHTGDLDFQDTRRVVPIGSLDAGLVFERDTQLFGGAYQQTLEPRLFYTHIPYRKQTQIANFDSAVADFSFAQLFQENRYIGHDRLGDANHLSLGLTSRFFASSNGREQWRASVGQRFYFSDQRVNLGELVRDRNTSDVLAAIAGRLGERWSVEGNMQFNAKDALTERLNFSTRYQPEPRKSLAVSYRFQRNVGAGTTSAQDVKNVDFATQWPIGNGFYGVGRVNFAVPERRVVEAVAGIEYDGDCWVGRLVVQRIATGTQKATNSIFWQIELNGLSRVGSNPMEILKRNIPGYSVLNDLEIGRRRASVLPDLYQPLE